MQNAQWMIPLCIFFRWIGVVRPQSKVLLERAANTVIRSPKNLRAISNHQFQLPRPRNVFDVIGT